MLARPQEKKRLEMDLLESYRKLQHARAATILGLAKLAEYRDEAPEPIWSVSGSTPAAGRGAGQDPRYREYIDQRYIDDIYQSAILHDIGQGGNPGRRAAQTRGAHRRGVRGHQCHTLFGGDAITSIPVSD